MATGSHKREEGKEVMVYCMDDGSVFERGITRRIYSHGATVQLCVD